MYKIRRHRYFVHKGLFAPALGLHTCGKTLKMCIKSELKEICLKLAANGRSDNGFLLTSKVCPQRGFCPCRRAIYIIKSLKMCIKSDFEEIILKLATYGQREKAFLLSSKFCPQEAVCPCPGAIYMYKSIKIYTSTRCKVVSNCPGHMINIAAVPKYVENR